MTLDEALQLPAGREVDKLIAERLFGWRWYTSSGTNQNGEKVYWFDEPDHKLPDHWKKVTNDAPRGAGKEHVSIGILHQYHPLSVGNVVVQYLPGSFD